MLRSGSNRVKRMKKCRGRESERAGEGDEKVEEEERRKGGVEE